MIMRRFLLLLFLSGAARAYATCVTSPPVSLGNGVTCELATDNFQNTNSGAFANVAVNFNPKAGWQSVVMAYTCSATNCKAAPNWLASTEYSATSGTGCGISMSCVSPTKNNPCGFTFYATAGGTSGSSPPTWSTLPCQSSAKVISDGSVTWGAEWLQIADGASRPVSCFSWSPSSPAQLQVPYTGNGYLNWAMYCPGIPALSGGQLKALCMVGNSNLTACTALGLMASAYTGLCTGSSCIDTDGFASNANEFSTSLDATTTAATNHTNEMVFYLGGTVNDEALTPTGGCADISEGNANGLAPRDANIVAYKATSSSAVETCGQTWSPGDAGGAMTMTVLTAISQATSQRPAQPTDLSATVQ